MFHGFELREILIALPTENKTQSLFSIKQALSSVIKMQRGLLDKCLL